MDKNDVISMLRLNGLHTEAEYVLKLQAQRKELLEALKDAKKKGSRWHPADPVVQKINAAIEKAEA